MGMPDNPEIWKAAAMADQFDKMQKLPDPLPGAPNFHRIPGYKVYTTGQPTLEGIKNVLEKVTGTIYPKDGPIIWLNLRQEPDVYVNGQPICARPPNKIGEYAELGAVTRDLIKADEAEFFKVVEGRVKENGGKLKYVTISKEEKEVEVKELTTLSEAMLKAKEDFPGLVHWRVPVCNSASPLETDFDIICNTLVGTSINTPVIVTDQVGLSRATTGSVIACLFKEFQINASFEGLVETVPGVNLDLLKMDKYTMDPAKDPLFRGEFEVVKELVATLKDGAAQAFLKMKIMDNIHKYYYLIVFTAYMREAADKARNNVPDDKKAELTLTGGKCAIPADQLKLDRKFANFMEDNKNLIDLCETG